MIKKKDITFIADITDSFSSTCTSAGKQKLVWLPEDAGDIGEYDTQIN